jgi:hypothetical protein
MSDRLHRHGLSSDATCTLSLQHVEGIGHLLLGCMYNQETWFLMMWKCGWPHLAPAAEEDMVTWWLRAWDQVPKSHLPIFDSLVLLTARVIWPQRNDRVFNTTTLSPALLVQRLELLLDDWCKANLVAV